MSIYTPNNAFPNEKIAAEDMSILQETTYRLSVDFDDLVTPERTRKRKAKGHARTDPPRPQNAWTLFLQDFGARTRREAPHLTITEVSALASKEWKSASSEVKTLF